MGNLRKNAFYNSLNTTFNFLTPLVTFPYLTRTIGPEGIGLVTWADSITSIISIFATFGIPFYGVREVAKRSNDKAALETIVKELISLSGIFSIILFIVYVGLIFIIPQFHVEKTLFLISSLNILFTPFYVIFFYQGIEEFSLITKRTFIIKIFIISTLFIFIKGPKDYYIWTLIITTSNIAGNLFFFFFMSRYFNLKFKLQLFSSCFKHCRPLFYFLGISIFLTVLQNFDKIYLGFIVNSNEVGYYTTSMKFIQIYDIMLLSVATVLIPSMSRFFAERNHVKINQVTDQFLSLIFLITLPSIIVLIFYSNEIIRLFAGSKFLESIGLLQIASPLILINSLINFLGYQIMLSAHKEKEFNRIIGFAMIVNIVLNIFLIPVLKSKGAIIALVITNFMISLLAILNTKDLIKVNFLKLGKNYLLGSIAVISVSLIFNTIYIENIILNLIIKIPLIILIYITVLLLLKDKYLLNELDLIKTKYKSNDKK